MWRPLDPISMLFVNGELKPALFIFFAFLNNNGIKENLSSQDKPELKTWHFWLLVSIVASSQERKKAQSKEPSLTQNQKEKILDFRDQQLIKNRELGKQSPGPSQAYQSPTPSLQASQRNPSHPVVSLSH